jgi:hypothetical protein
VDPKRCLGIAGVLVSALVARDGRIARWKFASPGELVRMPSPTSAPTLELLTGGDSTLSARRRNGFAASCRSGLASLALRVSRGRATPPSSLRVPCEASEVVVWQCLGWQAYTGGILTTGVARGGAPSRKGVTLGASGGVEVSSD